MRHSVSIDKTKTVKESLGRYTDNQLMTVLDQMIHSMIEPVIRHTRYLDLVVPTVLSWYCDNTGRKIALCGNKEQVFTHLAMFLHAKSAKDKYEIYKQIGFERNLSIFFVKEFLRICKDVESLELRAVHNDKAARSKLAVLCQDLHADSNLARVVQNARSWYEEAVSLRNKIVEKYMRYGMMQATYACKTNGRLELDDVSQNLMLAVTKAVNKVNPEKGVLTSYVTNWITQSRHSPTYAHEYNVAYDIPNNEKVRIGKGLSDLNNLSHSYDGVDGLEEIMGAEETDEVERMDLALRIRYLAKLVDPKGGARHKLGIGEYLTEQELNLLRSTKSRAVLGVVTRASRHTVNEAS